MIGAERGHERIAVKIKTFLGPSEMHEFELAVGQYVFYRVPLGETDAERHLYLAVPIAVARTLFEGVIARPVLDRLAISVIASDVQQEVIVTWKT